MPLTTPTPVRLESATARVRALVCDYGGVLTNPLSETYEAFAEHYGISVHDILVALERAAELHGSWPMAELESARITEQEFLDRVRAQLPQPAPELTAEDFRVAWFAGRRTNQEFVSFLHSVRPVVDVTALLTNNVAEWRETWRAGLPVDQLFDVVVDSSDEGVRKPDPEIYLRLLERIGIPAQECLFVDDVQANCDAAQDLGMRTVLFEDTATAIVDIRALLPSSGRPR